MQWLHYFSTGRIWSDQSDHVEACSGQTGLVKQACCEEKEHLKLFTGYFIYRRDFALCNGAYYTSAFCEFQLILHHLIVISVNSLIST